jgi:hypothetical protein
MLKTGKILRGGWLAVFLVFTTLSNAQNELTQTIRGRVVDAVTGAPIPSVAVSVSDKMEKKETDTEGAFRFDKMTVGRYNISLKCLGFQSLTLQNIAIESGKETVLELKMTASNTLLDSFEVRSTTTALAKIGLAESVNMETLQRLPANFSDVARMLTTVAGVSSETDAANHISVRGLSPNALQWFLEGAEIVNPNHLSNAGTIGDRATQNGGGVSIFSTQVLERADFYKGSTPTDFGNALGGAVDVRFRNGNDEHRETTLGIGLIGLDVATEGVLSKKSKASYLVNYRYSTVGLLSKLGVPLGDEATAFQDISFKLHFPTQKLGDFSVFGMGGISENIFVHKKRDKWLSQKDSQDIAFRNNMGVVGLSHSIRLNQHMNWQTVAALSALEGSRIATGFNASERIVEVTDFRNVQRKIFVKTQLNQAFQAGVLSVGMVIKNEFLDNRDSLKFATAKYATNISRGQGMFYMPFADFSGKFGVKWAYSVGVRANYFSLTKRLSVEPTGMIQRHLRDNESLKLTYSRQSQTLPPSLYFSLFYQVALQNTRFDFTKSDNLSLTYTRRFANDVQFSATAFGQFYRNVPYFQSDNFEFQYWSVLDNFDNLGNQIGLNGLAQSVGVEANIYQNNNNGWFWQLNATLFDATFKSDAKATSRPLAYNSRFMANGYFGKEWTLGSRRNRFLGVGSRTILRGGNVQRFEGNYFLGSPSKQIKPYFRSDLNVYVKRNRKNWSSTLQLDIQNVTNKANEQYYYYDAFLGKTTPQYQLGLLPNLSYRISF